MYMIWCGVVAADLLAKIHRFSAVDNPQHYCPVCRDPKASFSPLKSMCFLHWCVWQASHYIYRLRRRFFHHRYCNLWCRKFWVEVISMSLNSSRIQVQTWCTPKLMKKYTYLYCNCKYTQMINTLYKLGSLKGDIRGWVPMVRLVCWSTSWDATVMFYSISW